jgi:dipeptidyl aminopeptidase/acylaminoacyl peptidase
MTPLGLAAADPGWPAWSPDGTKIVYQSGGDIWTANADGTGATDITNTPSVYERTPAWSPAFDKIAFGADTSIVVSRADGSARTTVTTGVSPNWSPNGRKLVFADSVMGHPAEIFVADETGGGRIQLTNNAVSDESPAWSPDGQRITLSRNAPDSFRPGADIWTIDPGGAGELKLTTDGNQQDVTNYFPDWQPIPYTGYARPKGASPLQVSLLPAYKPCVAANRTHGSPLSFGSCAPPQQTSDYLTVGTPDANGQPPKSVAEVIYKVKASAPADVLITVLITDVRNKSDLTDYTGEVRVNGVSAPFAELRITDRFNGESSTEPGTVVDIPAMPTTVACAPTADTTVGSSCNTLTSMNAVVAGSVVGGKRAIWQFDQITVVDGGADGNVATTDNTIFLKQGVFVP